MFGRRGFFEIFEKQIWQLEIEGKRAY